MVKTAGVWLDGNALTSTALRKVPPHPACTPIPTDYTGTGAVPTRLNTSSVQIRKQISDCPLFRLLFGCTYMGMSM